MNCSTQLTNESARKIFLLMFFSELLLVLFYWIDILLGSPSPVLHALVDLDGEGNLPAWFSSFQLALISLACWLLAFQQAESEKPSRPFLILLAATFLLWSLDETAMLHERTTALLGSRYVDWLPDYLLDHKIIIITVAAMLFITLRMLWNDLAVMWREHQHESLIAIQGFAICFFGGAILETIGYKFFADGVHPFLYQTEVCFEELLEMLGASFLLYSAISLAVTKRPEAEQNKVESSLHAINFTAGVKR